MTKAKNKCAQTHDSMSSLGTATTSSSTSAAAPLQVLLSASTATVASHSSRKSSASSSSSRRDLPRLFYYMEMSQWDAAVDRLRRNPHEAGQWGTVRTRSMDGKILATKRLALHHACFKLRSASALPVSANADTDPFCAVCKFILHLVQRYPDAAGQRESRHGCLPLHLAAFATCASRPDEVEKKHTRSHSHQLVGAVGRPAPISKRTASDATSGTCDTMHSAHTNMSAVHAQEVFSGTMGAEEDVVAGTASSPARATPNTISVSLRHSAMQINAQREEMAVQVMNALLDAYPRAARVDSEGGRMPLHTACAGRATPRVISTLVTAHPSAARHRNKDGFLPLHLVAHWGVSHPDVAISLLKTYPDATVGRNRWERTPLEEALCMAGENGRPHQALLVRALRKHPSYWSRPPSELFRLQKQRLDNKSTIVDVDESLPSNDSTTLEEQMRHFDLEALMEGLETGNNRPGGGIMGRLRKSKKDDDSSLAVGIKLSTLIQNQKWDSVLARLEINPHEAEEELQEMTRGGFFATVGMAPLHYACERKPPVEVVQALLELYPMAIMTRTMPGGALPLHVACTWYASADVVDALLSADPGSAAKVTDELGNIALHSACFSGAGLDVIESLVAADPKTCLVRNHQGSRPIDICKRLRHPNRRKVMALLTLKKEEVMARHRRSRSSGNWSDVANEAAQLDGAALGEGFERVDLALQEEAVGVEVSYQGQGQATEELVWI